jgi:hypothetical protein
VAPERLLSLEEELIESDWWLQICVRSSKNFCKVFITQGRKLRRIKTTIRGTRRDSSQESKGD